MVQDIVAYLIIGAAFGFLLYKIFQFFNLVEKKSAKCSGCASGCTLKELHIVNKTKFDKKDQYRFYL